MTDTQAQSPKSKTDRRVKLAFGAVVVLIVVGVAWTLLANKPLKGWESDYQKALSKAAQDNTSVLVFYHDEPLSKDDKDAIANTLNSDLVRKRLANSNIVRLELSSKRDAGIAAKYLVTKTPSFLMLDSNGELLGKIEGRTDHVKFVEEVLDKAK